MQIADLGKRKNENVSSPLDPCCVIRDEAVP